MTSAGADPPERGSAEGIKLNFGRKNVDARSIPVTTRKIDATREPAAVGPPRAGKPLGRALSFGSTPRSTPAQQHALLTQLAEVSRLPRSDQLTRMAHAQSSLEQYLHKMCGPLRALARPIAHLPVAAQVRAQGPVAPAGDATTAAVAAADAATGGAADAAAEAHSTRAEQDGSRCGEAAAEGATRRTPSARADHAHTAAPPVHAARRRRRLRRGARTRAVLAPYLSAR